MSKKLPPGVLSISTPKLAHCALLLQDQSQVTLCVRSLCVLGSAVSRQLSIFNDLNMKKLSIEKSLTKSQYLGTKINVNKKLTIWQT